MTITQLKYLISVAENKNFTIAAEKCFVTQPTLSMQIQKLEEELDILIFDRRTKPVKITEVGSQILEQAYSIVSEANRMQDIVDQFKGYIGGELRLGIIPTIMPTLLPMFLHNFTKKYPKVELAIEELNTEDILTKLHKGHLDCAIAATPLNDDKIKEYPLYYEPFVAYVPESNALSVKGSLEVEDLDTESILLLQDGHCFTNSVLNMCQKNISSKEKNFRIESGSFETLIKLADEGLGYTLLPYLHTLEMNEKNKAKLKEFNDPKPAREVSLIFPSQQLKIHTIQALREVISGVVRGAIHFQDVKIISPVKNSKN